MIRKRWEELRGEPEHVRLRAATTLTAVSGVVLGVIWMTVLLPLQLHMTSGRTGDDPVIQAVTDVVRESEVSGARVEATPTPVPEPLLENHSTRPSLQE